MLGASYRKRLESDLARWVAAGLVPPEGALAIRRELASAGGFGLPALLGLLGGLLIAASLSAFVAANWESMPRLLRLGLVLAVIAGSFLLAAQLERRGASRLGVEAASTFGVLAFGTGMALVGQMYHLPADWPAGALLVALGGLAVALLMRSDGALMLALVAMAVWTGGRWAEANGALQPAFLLLFAPAAWLALARHNRAVHHLAVLAFAAWLAMLPGDWTSLKLDYGLLAYALGLSAAYVALGALALDRGWPGLLGACLPWGLLVLVGALSLELVRILDRDLAAAGTAIPPVFVAYALACATTAGLAFAGHERRFARALALALLLALLVPLVFWSGVATTLPGRIAVAALLLASAVALIVAGAAGGIRRVRAAGSALFGLSILILLWQTIGTLLDQSLFFLVAGAALIGLATGARRLFARLEARPQAQP